MASLETLTATVTPLDAETLRARLMHNRVDLDTLAQALGKHPRTIYNYSDEPDGLPFVRIDSGRWFDVDEAIEWLSKRHNRRRAAAARTCTAATAAPSWTAAQVAHHQVKRNPPARVARRGRREGTRRSQRLRFTPFAAVCQIPRSGSILRSPSMSYLHPSIHSQLSLSEEQQHAFDSIVEFVNGTEQLLLIGGAAGTGKSRLLNSVAHRYLEAILAAPTNFITRKLSKAAGRPAWTLHKLLYHPHEVISEIDGKKAKRLDWLDNSQRLDGRLVLIDEASLVSDRIGRDLLKRGARVIAFGDPYQLPPVDGDPFFTQTDIELYEIHRQAANSGINRQAQRILCGYRCVSDREFQVVDRCGSHLEWADVRIAWRNDTRRDVNTAMRRMRGIEAHALPQRGEPLICVATDHRNGIINGEQFVVVESQREGRPLILHGAAGTIQIARPHIADITDGEPARWQTQLALGYCLTAHKAQGGEWNRVLILDEGMWGSLRRRWLYTAVTRGIEEVKLARGEGFADLRRLLRPRREEAQTPQPLRMRYSRSGEAAAGVAPSSRGTHPEGPQRLCCPVIDARTGRP